MSQDDHNILIAPGAFKHSLSATDVASAIEAGLIQSGIQATYQQIPIADGGNGTVDAWLAQGGRYVHVPVTHPTSYATFDAQYGILPDGKTAIVEMALASGIELVPDNELNPMTATTYGTGQLLQHALEQGVSRIIVGMGGSATVDGGAGALQALGVRMLNSAGESVGFGAASLAQITHIDMDAIDPRWHDIELIIASDVENPLLGETGAVAVFAPQKGASNADLPVLEAHLAHFAQKLSDHTGNDIRQRAGGGAAGGLAAGLFAVLGGRIESGIDLLLAHQQFSTCLRDTHLLVTGEGRIDAQTIYGKGPIGVARLAHEMGIPTVAIVGGLDVDEAELRIAGIDVVLPIVNAPMSLEMAIANAQTLITHTARRLGYILQSLPH